MIISRRGFVIAGAGSALAASRFTSTFAAAAPAAVEMQTLSYATIDGKELLLDLYRPVGAQGALPLIVFAHGGGWSGGTRTTGPDFKRFFAQDGFAIAALDYRLTPSITFPSNAEDVKTAVRWLRANAAKYNLNPGRVGLWGTSAGGHLVSIAGLTPRGTFEGTGNLDQSSEVQCVLDAYGPVAFQVMDAQTEQEKPTLHKVPAALAAAPPMIAGAPTAARPVPPPTGAPPAGRGKHDDATSAESRLVGAPIQTVPDKVKAASPLTYVSSKAPPFLIMHGLADDAVPHHQSVLLYEALAKAGNDVTLRLIDGLPHTFFNRSNLDELAGPYHMSVQQSVRGSEKRSEDRAGVFDVARNFFTARLK